MIYPLLCFHHSFTVYLVWRTNDDASLTMMSYQRAACCLLYEGRGEGVTVSRAISVYQYEVREMYVNILVKINPQNTFSIIGRRQRTAR